MQALNGKEFEAIGCRLFFFLIFLVSWGLIAPNDLKFIEVRRLMKTEHFSMLRTYRAVDFFTLANGAAGTGAIFAVISYVEAPDLWRIYLAFCLFPLALLLDIADGKIARRQNKDSLFGGELDSLADIVSFGVAPAVLAYGLGMRGGLDVPLLLFFVSCGISRLARYNITAAETAAAVIR